MPENCEVCREAVEPSERFCEIHRLAHKNLRGSYARWKSAYSGQILEVDFLKRALSLDETGRAAREVISFLIRQGGGIE